MRKRSLHVLIALAALLASASGTPGRAEPAPAQKFDPAQCQYDDKACISGWYDEYSGGILAELKYYAGQQDFIARMQRQPDETLINARLSLIMIEGGMRFDQWVALKDDEAAKLAGLNMLKYRAISAECREAVADLRGALFDLRQHPARVTAGLARYRRNATICAKVFALTLPKPKPLAENDSGDGAGPAPALRPLAITPAKAKRGSR